MNVYELRTFLPTYLQSILVYKYHSFLVMFVCMQKIIYYSTLFASTLKQLVGWFYVYVKLQTVLCLC